jgi:hypothetical protein
MLYLQGMSSILEREGRTGLDPRWTITPVGGSGKVSTFVSLLGNQQGLKLGVLVDVTEADSDTVEALYKKKLLNRKNVHTYGDFVGSKDADVEDMFDRDFYVELLNGEYAKQLSSKVAVGKLNAKIPRVVKAIDEHFASRPLKSGSFSHFRPARYFVENLTALSPKLSDEAKRRFEAAFETLNGLL